MTISELTATTYSADKLLFTPGPLTTSATVKAAMQRDVGSRDDEFIQMVRQIRARLLKLAGQTDDSVYSTVLMQGSGTFGIEATISSVTPPDGKLLILINGAYGKRMAQIAAAHHIPAVTLVTAENATPDLAQVEAVLQADPTITTIAAVHCETTTGILNPITAIGALAARFGKTFIVDSMSAFGAIPVDLVAWHCDYLVSSSNKCIEGVPGFSFILARKANLEATVGYARTLSLDLLAQWHDLEKSGQFRFTPPTHALLAFHQALVEIEAEGGVTARAARYRANHEVIVNGMRLLGFKPYLRPEQQSIIITTFYYPESPNFIFETFYGLLSERGCVIYPGKLAALPAFRIGNIGRLYPVDMELLLDAIRETLLVMNVSIT